MVQMLDQTVQHIGRLSKTSNMNNIYLKTEPSHAFLSYQKDNLNITNNISSKDLDSIENKILDMPYNDKEKTQVIKNMDTMLKNIEKIKTPKIFNEHEINILNKYAFFLNNSIAELKKLSLTDSHFDNKFISIIHNFSNAVFEYSQVLKSTNKNTDITKTNKQNKLKQYVNEIQNKAIDLTNNY